MPFINERIPEDFKKSFDFSKIAAPSQYWTPKDIELYKWTTDKERDAFLLPLEAGGRGLPDEPRHVWFMFYSRGDQLYFDADHIETNDQGKKILTWAYPNIVAAIEPLERRQEVLEQFYEALDTMGVLWNRSRVDVVKLGDLTLGLGGK